MMSKTGFIGIAAVVAVVLLAIAYWTLTPIDHIATGSSQREFDLECDFAKFRQIMVRKNATKAIVAHGGLTLLSESVQDVKIDMSKDDRPILNAIRGQSKAELDATTTITVRLNDDQIKNSELTLRQQADVDENRLHVVTASIGEQESVKKYATTLTATSLGDRTHVDLTIEMTIEVSVPKLFVSRAEAGVADAAKKALEEQQEAITKFVIENSDKAFIMPELK